MGDNEKPAEGSQAPPKSAKGKKHVKSKKWTFYDLENKKKKKRSCPKCGPGVFLAEHKNRVTCGKCRYTEISKPDSEKTDQK